MTTFSYPRHIALIRSPNRPTLSPIENFIQSRFEYRYHPVELNGYNRYGRNGQHANPYVIETSYPQIEQDNCYAARRIVRARPTDGTTQKFWTVTEPDRRPSIEIIAALGSPLDFREVLGTSFTCELTQLFRDSNYSQRRTVCSNTTIVDRYGHISFFNEEDKETLAPVLGTDKIKTIRVKSLFKGSSPVRVEITDQTPNQVMAGERFFLFKRKINHLQLDGTIETKEILCLGCFTSLEKIIRFEKSRTFLAQLVNILEGHVPAEALLNRENYNEALREVAGPISAWWNGIAKLCPTTLPSEYHRYGYDDIEKHLKAENYIQNKEYRILASGNVMASTNEQRSLARAARALERSRQAITQKEGNRSQRSTDIVNNTEAIRSHQERIKRIQRDITYWQQCIETFEKELERYEQEITQLKEAQPVLEKAHKEALEVYTQKLNEYLEGKDGEKVDWTENLKQSGVVILDILYIPKNERNTQAVSIKKDPLVATNEAYRLYSVEFMTLKPSIITIGDPTAPRDTRVGGPYMMKITQATPGHNPLVEIRLASLKSVFGYSKDGNAISAKAHPHVYQDRISATVADIAEWAKQYRTVCAGEMAPALCKAFSSKQPKYIVFAALAWMTSCNPNDAYGKYYKWFPTVKEVNLTPVEPDPEPEAESKEEVNADEKLFRRFECRNENSQKFWEVIVNGTEYTTRWGKIGSEPRSNTRTYAHHSLALRSARVAISTKLMKGYVEVNIDEPEGIVQTSTPNETINDIRRMLNTAAD